MSDSPQPSQRRRRIIQGYAILVTVLISSAALGLGIGTTSLRVISDSQGVSVALQPGWRSTTTAEAQASQTHLALAADTATSRANLYATGTQVAGALATAQAEVTQRTATAALQATGTQLSIQQATAFEQATRTAHMVTLTAGPGATATARADLLTQAEDWPLVLTDSFDSSGHWTTGSYADRPSSIEFSVEDGVYLWEIANAPGAGDGWSWTSLSHEERRENTFALSVDVRQVEGHASAYFGMQFHANDNWTDFYTVLFSDSQPQVEAYWVHDAEWEIQLSRLQFGTVRPGQRNRLVVIAQDNRYDVYINEKWIGQFRHTGLTGGWIGLIAGLSDPGARAVIEFDNFEFRAP